MDMSCPFPILTLLCAAFVTLCGACSTADDCSHNGACVSGACVCTAGWTGTACSVLDVAPVDKTKWGYMPIPDGFTSWGGAVLKDGGKYHMWVSENANKCGMNTWGTNSRCIHTEATSPEGPYTKTGVVFGPMCHEPKVIKAPTGETVMFFTGIYDGVTDVGSDGTGGFSSDHGYTPETEFLCDCSTGATAVDGNEAPLFGSCVNTASSDPTWMSWTTTPGDDASWSKPVMIIDPRDETSATGFQDAAFAGDTIDTNFAPVEIQANGSLLAMWRSWQDCPTGGGGTFCSVIHTASATHWKCSSAEDCKTKYTFQTRNIFADEGTGPAEWGANELFVSKGIEDPFGWKDSQGVFHAIFHYMVSERDLTSHAWSTDFFGKWTHTGDANVQNVSFTDGTFAKFESCERPNLVVDDAGKPVALATACNAGTNPPEGYMIEEFPILESSEFAVDDAAFTLVQPLLDGTNTNTAPVTTEPESTQGPKTYQGYHRRKWSRWWSWKKGHGSYGYSQIPSLVQDASSDIVHFMQINKNGSHEEL
mmetsp:Transcript_127456/g.302851  ORF Transcript_127456/g.302851 Transcript_127456/m.302851 type:complete len:535 (-) Transcript_127456:61-1665(-)